MTLWCDHDFHVTMDSGTIMGQYLEDGSGWRLCVKAPEIDSPGLDGSDAGPYLPDVLRTDREALSDI